MRKVLLIGFFWPYRDGSRRVHGLAKYLPGFGWEPLILTGPLERSPNSQFRVFETPSFDTATASFKRKLGLNPIRGFQEQIGIPVSIRESKRSFLDKLLLLVKGIITYPDEYKNWKPGALQTAERILREEKIDAVISIWPVTSHLIAKELKQKYKIPWIADFPDPWSQNHYYPYGPIRKWFDKRLELKTISKATAITAAAPLYVDRQEQLHKRQVHLILHGFDSEDFSKDTQKLSKKFTITYTGTIYTGKQNPEKLFIALKNLISQRIINPQQIEVRFYGPENSWLTDEIKKYNLRGIVKQYKIVPREIALQKQKESQLLLLLNWEDPKEKGVYPSKLFEYLASQRPILAAGGFHQDYLEKIINETQGGVYASTVKEIEDALSIFYKEYKNTGKVAFNGNLEEIKKYSYRSMAEKFADVLNEISSN